MIKRILALLLILSILMLPGCSGDKSKETDSSALEKRKNLPVTMESLLNEMVDWEQLMIQPIEGEKAAQFSSYDRLSRVVKGEKVDWFENGDHNKFIRNHLNKGRMENVMAEAEGPGVITRIWSATPRGTLRIYIDGSEDPIIEEDFTEMAFGYGDYPFTGAFAGRHGSGGNIYFPIPFEKSMLVTIEDPGWFYYHVNYRTFPKGTKVESYSPDRASEVKELAMKVENMLSNPYEAWEEPDNAKSKEISGKVEPGQAMTVELDGSSEITKLELKLDADDVEKSLRDTLIQISWDDFESPSVWSPLGDFFGSAPGYNPYQGLPMGMLENGTMYSHWPMPFKKKAVIKILNEGDEEIALEGRVVTKSIKWDDSYLYFHAKWHSEKDLPSRPIADWTALETQGPGRFVGLSLQVTNPSLFWWGEGDEKIYVDGEEFPSTFGTGTEDYFGYAWCNPEVFSHAYHNQPRADVPSGHISNNRFHIFDNIPFQKSLKFDLERYSIDEGIKMDYAATSYWYTGAVNKDFYKPIPVEERYIRPFDPIISYKEEGVLEGESLKITKVIGGNAGIQGMTIFGNKWSDGKHIIWTPDDINNTLEFELPVEKAGKYNLTAALTKAPDYGQVKVEVNGQVVAAMIDLYDTHVTADTFSFGEVELAEGANSLKFTIIGQNPSSTKILFALDYIKLELAD